MWNLSSGQRLRHIRALRTSRKRFNQQESRSADRSIGPRCSCALNEIVSAAPDATWPQSWMQRENWEFETHRRIVPISLSIAEALARRRARRDPDSPLVFHGDGIPIRR